MPNECKNYKIIFNILTTMTTRSNKDKDKDKDKDNADFEDFEDF